MLTPLGSPAHEAGGFQNLDMLRHGIQADVEMPGEIRDPCRAVLHQNGQQFTPARITHRFQDRGEHLVIRLSFNHLVELPQTTNLVNRLVK